MTEYAAQVVIMERTRSLQEIQAALPVRRCELNRLTSEVGLPLPGWEINIWGATKETVERHLNEFLGKLDVQPGELQEFSRS